jgi:V/A-type H+-transporting ATPase subunit C
MYRSLIHARKLQEVSSVLAQSIYQDTLVNLDQKDPIEIEQILLHEEIRRLKKIEKHSHHYPEQIIRWFLERYDCEKLKILLRMWHRGSDANDTEFLRWKIIYDYPQKEILSAGNLSEIVLLLNGNPFQEPLHNAVSLYNEAHTLFPIELALDQFLFNRIWNAVEIMDKKDGLLAKRLLGIEVDLKNLDWIGRYRKYYEIPIADIGRLLLSHGYHFSIETLRQVAAEGNYLNAFARVAPGFEMATDVKENGNSALQVMERMLYHILFNEAGKAFSKFPFSIGAVLGYYYLIKIETRNIRTLIHAKIYNLSPEEIEMLLVM